MDIQTPRMEFFQCPDFQQKKESGRAGLSAIQPYKKAPRIIRCDSGELIFQTPATATRFQMPGIRLWK